MDQIVKQLPRLEPLRHSFAVDDAEHELNQLFIELFETYLSEKLHDVNVLGMAHLGSIDLVKRMITADGLVVINNNREEFAARRLYRAWKSINCQGRGLHLLKAYLQLLFPNAWQVSQQVQLTGGANSYPNQLVPVEQNVDPTAFLTSRVQISIAAGGENAGSAGDIAGVIRAIVPARIVPQIQILQTSQADFRIGSFFTVWSILRTEGTTL